jgi:cyclase
MKKLRLIARLDVKNDHVIKGIHLEGLRKVGDPQEFARRYYQAGVDEILFMDAVASLYERNNLFHIINRACEEVFIPITIGGGIRSLHDIEAALASGADKVALNTQAIKTPGLIREASHVYGSQCIVASIEAKRKSTGWEAYTDNGREATGRCVLEWVEELEELGAGEILVTSIDKEGTQKGFDIALAKEILSRVNIPVVFSGGAGKTSHLSALCEQAPVDGIAIASVLHYDKLEVRDIKEHLRDSGTEVRL